MANYTIRFCDVLDNAMRAALSKDQYKTYHGSIADTITVGFNAFISGRGGGNNVLPITQFYESLGAPDEKSRVWTDFVSMLGARYYMDEIGTETPELFKLSLVNAINKNAYRYHIIYSQLQPEDYWDYNYSDTTEGSVKTDGETDKKTSMSKSEETNRESTDRNTSHTSSSGNSQSITSDSPQTNFSGADYASGAERGRWDGSDQNTGTVNSDGSVTSVGSETGTEGTKIDNTVTTNMTNTHSGYRGTSKSQEILLAKETIEQINKNLVDDCAICFMGIY